MKKIILVAAALVSSIGMTFTQAETVANSESIPNTNYACDFVSHQRITGMVDSVAAEDALSEMSDLKTLGGFSYSEELGVCRSRTNGTQLMGQLRSNGVPVDVNIAKIDEKMAGAYFKVGAAIGAVVLPAVLGGGAVPVVEGGGGFL